MRIFVVVKEVPDSRATVKVRDDGSGIETRGVKLVCNPFDEFAVEQAVQWKEGRSDIEEVVVGAVGPASTAQTLRTALAMGADRAIHITGAGLPAHDDLFAARALALWIEQSGSAFNLVLCGKQTIDTDATDLGPALAEFLGRTHIGAVTSLELAEDGSSVRAHRRVPGAEEVIEAPPPLLVTCDRGLNEPRYPALPNIMKAKKKPLETVNADQFDGLLDVRSASRFVKLSPPAPKAPCRVLEGEPAEMSRELVRLLREEAKVI